MRLLLNLSYCAESRETVIDFTQPYEMGRSVLVSAALLEKDRRFAVFSPFTMQVIILLIVNFI